MDQKNFEIKLEEFGKEKYAIGDHPDGNVSLHVFGVDFMPMGKNPFTLFDEMVDFLNEQGAEEELDEEESDCECKAMVKASNRVASKILEFFGDANAVYEFTGRITGRKAGDLRTGDLDVARKINTAELSDAILEVFKHELNKANGFVDDLDEDNRVLDINETIQEMFSEDKMRKDIDDFADMLSIPKEIQLEFRDFTKKVMSKQKAKTRVKGGTAETGEQIPTSVEPKRAPKYSYPRIVEGVSGLVYMLLGDSGPTVDAYDCYVLGHKSREDATYRDEIGIVEKDRIRNRYEQDLSHQMNTRLQKALAAFAKYDR